MTLSTASPVLTSALYPTLEVSASSREPES